MTEKPTTSTDQPHRARRKRSGRSIADVARLAGVSAQTVSRVANDAAAVRPQTRQRVLEAMRSLGYSPNRAAQALRYGSFKTIGVVAHRLNRTGESLTFEAVTEAARGQGYTVTLVDTENSLSIDMDAAVRRLSTQSIDGLIIIRTETATPDTLSLPVALPVVVSDSRFVGHHPMVGTDQVTGVTEAVNHLLGLGHHSVHHLAGPSSSDPASIRIRAWQAALKAAGRPIPELVRGDWSAESGYRQGQQLTDDPSVSAVFAANDEMAIGAIRAFTERGLNVPGDISVVGFDGIGLAEYTFPPLTTVQQNFHQIGHELVALLFQQIEGKPFDDETRVLVPARLVVRASTAGPGNRTSGVTGH